MADLFVGAVQNAVFSRVWGRFERRDCTGDGEGEEKKSSEHVAPRSP